MLLFQIVFPLLAAVLVNFIRNKKIILSISIITIIINASIVLLIKKIEEVNLLTLFDGLNIVIKNDPFSSYFIVLTSLLFFVTAIYAYGYFSSEYRRFYRYFLFSLGIINGISLANNLITFFFFYEVLTLCTLPLIIFYKNDEQKYVGKKYVYFMMASSTIVFIAMMLFYSEIGSLDFTLGGILNQNNNGIILAISFIMMFLGFGIRGALVPFHSWLPASMNAPTPVSGLLDSLVSVKTGVFALIRITYFLYGMEYLNQLNIGGYLRFIVIITIIMGSFLAFHSKHLKKRLAYSTIAQLGYIILGITFFNKASLLGSIMHLANHATLKIVLFFIVGILIKDYGIEYLDEVDGIGKQTSVLMGIFTFVSLSLVGVPPLNGFTSKWYLSIGVLQSGGNVIFVMILLLGAFFTAAYLLPIAARAFFKSGVFKYKELDKNDKIMNLAVYLLLLINLVISIYPNFILNYIRSFILKM